MSNLMNAIRLDMFSVKSDIKPKSLIIYVIMAGIGYVTMGSPGIIMSILMLAGSLTTFTFSAGKNGLDTLYATLHISRKTTVLARYLFALFIYIIATVAYFLIRPLSKLIS